MRDTGAVELDTKVCPRCGELLFADMDVCYGCLYDFTRKRPRPLLPDPPRIDADDIPVGAGMCRGADGWSERLALHGR